MVRNNTNTTQTQNTMAVAFSKPESKYVYHSHFPLELDVSKCSYNHFVTESDGKITVTIPEEWSAEINEFIQEMFGFIGMKIKSQVEHLEDIDKFRVYLNCAIKCFSMMNPEIDLSHN